MQDHQLGRGECDRGVGSTVVIRELDFKNSRSEVFDDGADLPSAKPMVHAVLSQGDYIKQMEITIHRSLIQNYST